ncbi:MAG: TIGR03435 family protein, partial [Candidatus Solibacter sp.]
MKQLIWLAVLQGALLAQSIEGTWQGTLSPPNQNGGIRLVFKISKTGDDKSGDAYQGRFYNLANNRQLALGAITLQAGNAVKIAIPGNGMTYEGKIDAGGNSITGTLSQGTNPLPLPLKRATAETAWDLPPTPTAIKGLPEGTKLEFEVASVKPSAAGQPFSPGFNVTATEMRARNINLAGLIAFAYGLHRTQISGLPGWGETEGFDVVARLPPGGEPTDPQLLKMLQHMLQTRFNLAVHMDKRELSVYAIGIGKGGPAGIKMVKSDSGGLNIGSQGLGRVRFRGATMAGLASQLQLRVLDRPAVDQSGL